MPTATLDRRTLNRTLLDRQLLLAGPGMAAEDAVARLLGLQSQAPASPYPGCGPGWRTSASTNSAHCSPNGGLSGWC